MFKARTLAILAMLLLAYGVLWSLAALAPSGLDSTFGIVLMAPLLTAYLLSKLGVPGVLEHNGFCGWGWCAPTVFGWICVAIFLLTVAWLVAWAIASLATRFSAR